MASVVFASIVAKATRKVLRLFGKGFVFFDYLFIRQAMRKLRT